MDFACIAFMLAKRGFPGGSAIKNLSANVGDAGSIPGQEYPLEKEGNPPL